MALAGQYVLGPRIGKGGFGEVFAGRELAGARKVAVKVESARSCRKQLVNEVTAYRLLASLPEGSDRAGRFPALHWFGVVEGSYAIVLDLLGESLQSLFDLRGRRFGLSTVLSVADQMLACVARLHAVGLVHRDLKPNNFCVRLGGDMDTVHLIDFGLAGRWRRRDSLEHVGYGEHRAFVGNERFASINAHLGVAQSRRDDLLALGYIMIYFLRGSLPWDSAGGVDKQAAKTSVLGKKCTVSIEALCRDQAQEFVTYFRYCYGLAFSDAPDYSYLRSLFRDLLLSQECHLVDSSGDWTLHDLCSAPLDHSTPEAPGLDSSGIASASNSTAPSCASYVVRGHCSKSASTRTTPPCNLEVPDCSGRMMLDDGSGQGSAGVATSCDFEGMDKDSEASLDSGSRDTSAVMPSMDDVATPDCSVHASWDSWEP